LSWIQIPQDLNSTQLLRVVMPRFLLSPLRAAIDFVDSVLFAIPGKWWWA